MAAVMLPSMGTVVKAAAADGKEMQKAIQSTSEKTTRIGFPVTEMFTANMIAEN